MDQKCHSMSADVKIRHHMTPSWSAVHTEVFHGYKHRYKTRKTRKKFRTFFPSQNTWECPFWSSIYSVTKAFRPISIQCKISQDELFAITFFWNAFSQPDPLHLIACISEESDRKMSTARHVALSGNSPLRSASAGTTGLKLNILIQ
jgi:hypothetical protein